MVTYPVERLDEVTIQMLMDMGFSSELEEYLTLNSTTKDEVVTAMEACEDKNMKLDALIGSIHMSKEQAPAVVPEAEEQKSPISEVTAE